MSGSQSSAKQRVRRAREDAYRGLILEAAERVFAERGYVDGKVQEIAEEAGVATGTVYGIFASKQELYRAVHREALDALAKEYTGVAADGPAIEVILDRIARSTRFLTARPHYLRMYLREASRWGFDARELPAGALAFQDIDLYARGVADGDLIDEDPDVIAQLAMSAGQVFLHHWWKTGMREPTDALVERIQAHYRRAFFRN